MSLGIRAPRSSTRAGQVGSITGITINPDGWTATLYIKDSVLAGTYALTPDGTPKLTFSVLSLGYDNTGAQTRVARTVYGTVPLRRPYPQGTTNQESPSSGDIACKIALSDFIYSTDIVTATALASLYTGAYASAAASANIVVTNTSSQVADRPIGCWVSMTKQRRASGADMTFEFFVAHKYPRSNGQVACVVFTIDDGAGHTATATATSMTKSAQLLSTSGTATNTSAQLTSLGSTAGMIADQYLTAVYSSYALNTALGGQPKISTVDSSTAITLDKTATVTNSVDVTVGCPVYVYSVTFASATIDNLNQGVCTVKAVAYPNIGVATLDTSAGADGVAIAANVVTPNLKNLQFLNDKNTVYPPRYAWVGTSAGASPAVQTTATDPGSTKYYGSLKSAADALKTYYNSNFSHNDAFGGIIYIKAQTLSGTGGNVSDDAGSDGATYLAISAEPGHGPSDTILDAGASGNRDVGYTTLVQNLKIKDNATNSIILAGPDDASTSARQAHVVFQYCWLLATQSFAAIYQIGWREYYNCLIDQAAGDANLINAFSTTGVASNIFGSTVIGSGAANQYWLYNAMGNVFSNCMVSAVSDASANYITPSSSVFAFNKTLNLSAQRNLDFTGSYVGRNNAAFIQCVVEMTGTTNTNPAMSISADNDTAVCMNVLRQYMTIAGNRTNILYNDTGSAAITKTGCDLFNIEYQINKKADYFLGTQNGNRQGNWPYRHGVGCIGNVATAATGNDGGTSTAPSYGSWLGDYFGLTGSGTQGYNQTSFTYQSANQNNSCNANGATAGANTGFGYYKLNTTTGCTSRVPAGFAGLPYDIEGNARKNDGSGSAGAYEV